MLRRSRAVVLPGVIIQVTNDGKLYQVLAVDIQ